MFGNVVRLVKAHRTAALVGGACLVFFCSGTVFLASGVSEYVQSDHQSQVVAGVNAISRHDLPAAYSFFTRAAEDKDPLAYSYLAWIEASRGNFEKAAEYGRQAMQFEGGSGVYEIMGDLALLGYGGTSGAPAAVYYFKKAAEAFPQKERGRRLVKILERALDLCQNLFDYEKIVNEAAKVSSPKGMLARGDLEFLGQNQPLSPKSALNSWSIAAANGIPAGTTRTAALRWYGYGAKRAMPGAAQLFRAASRAGDPVAMYDMGLITLRGNNPNFIESGFSYMRSAADHGYGPAISAVAILSLDAGTDETGISNAYGLFHKAWQIGDPTGAIFYALMTYTGSGLSEPDHETAYAIIYDMKQRKIPEVSGILDFVSGAPDEKVEDAFRQLVTLCASQLYGEICFDDGDPAAAVYREAEKKSGERFVYYTPQRMDGSISPGYRLTLGNNFIRTISDPETVTVNGKKLLSPDFAKVLSVYNPTSGVAPFTPKAVPNFCAFLPRLPEDYAKYELDLTHIESTYGLDVLLSAPAVKQDSGAKNTQTKFPIVK